MNFTPLSKVEAGITRLADRDPDRAGEQNDIGFAGTHTSFGHRLAETIGDWTPKQAVAALKICRYYQNTQLADLAPFPTDAEVEADATAAQKVAAEVLLEEARATAVVEYGLEWDKPRTVRTRSGLSEVKSALPTELFWAAWRADKEAVKQQGLGLSKYNGAWQVAKWTLLEAAAPVREALPHVVAALSNSEGLREYQKGPTACAVASLLAFKAYLDTSDTGTGKTYMALAAFREIQIKPLAVCPKAVQPAWKRVGKYLGVEVDVVNYELVRRGNTRWGKWIGSTRAKTFQWNTELVKGLVFDEAHHARGTATQNSLLVRAAVRQGIPVFYCSATAADNPLHMRAIGYALGLHNDKDFWAWSQKYGCRPCHWGGFEFVGSLKDAQSQAYGKACLDRLHHEIFPVKGGRIRKSDLGPGVFPETQITAEAIDFGTNDQIQKIYEEMAEKLAAVEEARKRDKLKAAVKRQKELAITIRLRARQQVELLKVPAICSLAEDGVEEGNTVLIFVNFRETLAAVMERLSDLSPVAVYGDQSAEERQQAIDAIQNDEARVLAAMTDAGSEGISLHDVTGKHPRLSLISPSDKATKVRQVTGRPCRDGGKSKSIQKILFASDTVEEEVRANCMDKLERNDIFNDGDLLVKGDILIEDDEE